MLATRPQVTDTTMAGVINLVLGSSKVAYAGALRPGVLSNPAECPLRQIHPAALSCATGRRWKGAIHYQSAAVRDGALAL